MEKLSGDQGLIESHRAMRKEPEISECCDLDDIRKIVTNDIKIRRCLIGSVFIIFFIMKQNAYIFFVNFLSPALEESTFLSNFFKYSIYLSSIIYMFIISSPN